MMIWEGSNERIVNLCVEFRKAVVAEITAKPELGKKLLGAFTPEELAEFDRWSQEAMKQAQVLKQQSADGGKIQQQALDKLDKIVLDMSEKSAECALRVLGKEELQAFVKPQDRTEAISGQYKALSYPNLAKIFSPV